MIGTRLSDRYEILREIGRGGMGVVYAAHDPLLDREVAIKLLPPTVIGEGAIERFRREARVVAAMDHPSIVPVHDSGEHGGALYFVMPLVKGDTLRTHLRNRSLRAEELLEIAIQVAEALEYSHSLGVVHRDIKPENILVVREPTGTLRARVTDFGLARMVEHDCLTQTGALVGTVTYLSPEQVRGEEVDARSDVYALGTVLYECFTGVPPFAGDVHALLYRIAHDLPQNPRALGAVIPEVLEDVVMQCLEKNRYKRPQSAADLHAALGRCRPLVREPAARGVPAFSPGRFAARRSPGAMIGRAEEFAALQRLLNQAVAGECCLALVGGEAGTGKTRLLDELDRLAQVRGLRCLHGRFIERDRSFPYQAFGEALQEHLQRHSREPQPAAADLSDLAPDLARLFPALTEIEAIRSSSTGIGLAQPPEMPKPADRDAIFELLARTLARLTAGTPLLLLFENLHVSEVAVEALKYIFMRLAATPILIAGTFRSREARRGHPLLALIESFHGDRRFAEIRLGPFTEAEHRIFLEGVLGSSRLDEGLVETLYDATEGNPYFASELSRSLQESGGIVKGPSGFWRLPSEGDLPALPPTIQHAVERRVEQLPAELHEMLAVASVIGRRFDIEDLVPLVGLSRDEIERRIERLVEDGFLQEEPGARGDLLSFTSGVLRDAVYEAVPRRRRRSLHRKHAEEIELRFAKRIERVLPELVHHFAVGEVPDKVVRYGLEHARRLLAAFSPEGAARTARTVLEFLEADDDAARRIEAEARATLASAHRMEGDVDSALRELTTAVGLLLGAGGGVPLAAFARMAAETAWEGRRIAESRGWVERGIEYARECGDEASLQRLLTLGATLASLGGDPALSRTYQEEAERLGSRPGVSAAAVAATHSRGGLLHVPFAQRVDSLDPALVYTLAQAEVVPMIFETLTREAEGAIIVPWLASKFQIAPDGRSIRFWLREGIRFHDGRELTSRDVRHSLERILKLRDSEPRTFLYPIRGARKTADEGVPLDGVILHSRSEFTIELEQPTSYFPAVLAFASNSIVPEGWEGADALRCETCVGTGPFRMWRFEPGLMLDLQPNPGYWRAGCPKADGLRFSFGVTPAEILAGFRAGRFSLAWDLLPADVEALRRSSEFASRYSDTPRLSTYYLACNVHNDGPLADEKIREMLMGSVDVEDLVMRTAGRVAVPAQSLIPPGLLGHSAGRGSGAALLPKSRPPLNLKLTAMLNSSYEGPYAELAGELFHSLDRGGFHVQVLDSKSEYSTNQAAAIAVADLFLTRWVADFPDAENFAGMLHSQTGFLGRLLGLPEMDRLVERGRSEATPAVRHAIYREIEDILARRMLLLPLFHEKSYCFARREVQDFQINLFPPIGAYERLWVAG